MENFKLKCKDCQVELTKENCYVSKDPKYKKRQGILYECKPCTAARGKRWQSSENGREKHRLSEARRRLKNKEAYLWASARRRAKEKGIEFNIEVSDIFIPENCPVFGFKLVPSDGVNNTDTSNSPSIDRIDSSKGYIKGNIVVISVRANKLKSNASLEELEMLVNWFKKQVE